MGVPYLPTRSLLGSDILARSPRLRAAPCPFTGEPLVLVPALVPDVAILHVQRADPDGTGQAWGPTGVTAAAGKASRAVIVVCEELVEPAVVRDDPNRTLVPGFRVDAVVHLPWGAHPSPVQGQYNRDHAIYADYHRRTASAEGARAWLDEWVRDVPDHAGYLAKLGPARNFLHDRPGDGRHRVECGTERVGDSPRPGLVTQLGDVGPGRQRLLAPCNDDGLHLGIS